MDYTRDRRPHASPHRESHGREGRPTHVSRYASNHLSVDAGDHGLYPPSSPRSSSYSHPSPSPSGPRHSYKRSRSQIRWPPPPSVESEATSLSREYKPGRQGEPEPPCRGSIDQDPLMIDVQAPSSRREQAASGPGKLAPNTAADPSRRRRARSPGMHAIKTDVDSLPEFSARQPRPYNAVAPQPERKTSRWSGEYLLSPEPKSPGFLQSPEVGRRRMGARAASASHYDVPRPTRLSADESDMDSSGAEFHRSRARPSRYSFTRGDLPSQSPRIPIRSAVDSSDESMSERISRLRRGGTAAAVAAAAAGAAAVAATSSPRSSRPSTPISDHSRHGAPPPPRSSGPALSQGSNSNSTSDSGQRMAPVSRDYFPQSPPHSPKLAPASGTASPRHAGSRAGSRQNSRPSTPQSIPGDTVPGFALFEAVNHKLEGRSTYPPLKDDRSRRASRLSSSMRSESIPTPSAPRIDVHSPSPARLAKAPLPYPDKISPFPSSPLPYPETDSAFMMPSETAFQFKHPPTADADTQLRATAVPERVRQLAPPRPGLAARHSMSEGVPQTKNDRLSSPTTPGPSSKIDSLPRPTTPAPTAIPASCPRGKSSRGHTDWSTLTGDARFNICPDCLRNTVAAASPHFADSFQPAKRDSKERIRCDFSRAWVRLAWLLTLRRQRQDLELLYAVSAVSSFESECPGGDEPQRRAWYGVAADDDDPVPEFYMCGRDRRYVEALFPKLKPCVYRVSRHAHVCSLDRDAAQFGSFLDVLVATDEKARRAKRSPDLKELTDLAAKAAKSSSSSSTSTTAATAAVATAAAAATAVKFSQQSASSAKPQPSQQQQQQSSATTTKSSSLPPCPRDTLARGSLWHYMPHLPEFTVCPRCFAECVEPRVRPSAPPPQSPTTSSSADAAFVVAMGPLAEQFCRGPLPLAREGLVTRGMGASCQLYSGRMRRVWASSASTASEAGQPAGDDDQQQRYQYLARRVRERRAVEMGVYETYATLERMMQVPGYDKAAVREELDRVHREWAEVE